MQRGRDLEYTYVGEEDTDGDAELISCDQRTTDLLWRNLGHIENDCEALS
jgi:hypothetical protein